MPREYWSIRAVFRTANGEEVSARLTQVDGRKLDKFDIANEAQATELAARAAHGSFSVARIETRQTQRRPQPPFITSTLQQEAARKLGFGAQRTMRTAQRRARETGALLRPGARPLRGDAPLDELTLILPERYSDSLSLGLPWWLVFFVFAMLAGLAAGRQRREGGSPRVESRAART